MSIQSDKSKAKFYVERIKAEAQKQVQGPPLSSSAVDVEIIFAARGSRPDVDNVTKRLLDALKGIVYHSDKQVRSVKSVGLRLDESFYARGFNTVFQRLRSGKEFLVNVYEGGEVDVYVVDSATPKGEKPGVVALSKTPFIGISGSATAGLTGPTLEIERIEFREPEPREPRPSPPPTERA